MKMTELYGEDPHPKKGLRVPATVATVLSFATQVVLGAFGFAVVFLVAIGLAAMVHYFEGVTRIPIWMSGGAKYVEMGLWAADLFGFALFVISEVVKFAIRLWRDFKEDLNG